MRAGLRPGARSRIRSRPSRPASSRRASIVADGSSPSSRHRWRGRLEDRAGDQSDQSGPVHVGPAGDGVKGGLRGRPTRVMRLHETWTACPTARPEGPQSGPRMARQRPGLVQIRRRRQPQVVGDEQRSSAGRHRSGRGVRRDPARRWGPGPSRPLGGRPPATVRGRSRKQGSSSTADAQLETVSGRDRALDGPVADAASPRGTPKAPRRWRRCGWAPVWDRTSRVSTAVRSTAGPGPRRGRRSRPAGPT